MHQRSSCHFFNVDYSEGKNLNNRQFEKKRYYYSRLKLHVQVWLKNIDHLFQHCSVAIELWDFILCLVGMSWVMPRRVLDLLSSWAGLCVKKAQLKILGAIPSCLMSKTEKVQQSILSRRWWELYPSGNKLLQLFFAFNLDLLSFLDSLYLSWISWILFSLFFL